MLLLALALPLVALAASPTSAGREDVRGGCTHPHQAARCPKHLAVPEGFACWQESGSGMGRWASWEVRTTLIDQGSCRATGLLREGGAGSPSSETSFIASPGAGPSAIEQRRILQVIGYHAEDPSRPEHALAFLKRDLAHRRRANGSSELRPAPMPSLRWWPGSPPSRFPETWSPAEDVTPAEGHCPCYRVFSGSAFKRFREWPVGPARVVAYSTGARNRTLAILVAERNRYRWIHFETTFGAAPRAHVQGSTWWLAVPEVHGERTLLLAYDARTGAAWRVDLGKVASLQFLGDGLAMESLESGEALRVPWSALRVTEP